MSGPYDQPDDGPSAGRLPLPAELSPRGRAARWPAGAPRSRGRRAVRYASWVAVTASVLVLVLSGAAFAYYEHLNGNINRVPVFGKITGSRPNAALDGAQNILVVGGDSRVGETAAQLAQQHTTQDGGSTNTDTIIIVHLAPNDGPATLISIPRDSYVPIPGHGTFKINSAYGDGEADHKGNGPALLTQTVEDLTGLHIDHFISVGFSQFIDISNAIGGVKVCVVNPAVVGHGQYDGGAYDTKSGTMLTRGVHIIKGAQALAFVRQRYNLPNNDLDRIHRQQRFITGIVQKASNTTNPLTINNVLEQATKSLTVDSSLSGTGLAQLGNRLRGLKPADIRFTTVPIADPAATSGYGVSYVQLDLAKLQTFFANLKAERDPNAPAPTPSASALTPADVTLSVQNGSGVTGAAGRARSALTGYGYHVASVGTSSRRSATTIRYAPADAAAAAELANAVPTAQLASDSSLTAGTVELILGSDYTGTRDPASAASSNAAPTPTATATGSAPAEGTTSAGALLGGASIDGVPCGP